MGSFIYFFSKFTEEFLLLSSAGVFTLLSLYCYTWVVKKRRLGAARDQVPAGMVKVYLNQLINEAQFVRTQLFGLAGGTAAGSEQISSYFQANAASSPAPTLATTPTSSSNEIPKDLLERLKALENQLSDKESMVINVNVEKSKLLEEIEKLKRNEKSEAAAAPASNQNDLIQKLRALEERLEEYALFEDDLANLKRLQQENAYLKRQLDQNGPVVASTPAPPRPEPMAPSETKGDSQLDDSAINALLNGSSPIPPTPTSPTSSEKAKNEAFENLVDSIENSLSAPVAAAAPQRILEPAPAPIRTLAPAEKLPDLQAPPVVSSANEKTDEELLKEFENLLNS